MWSGNLRPWLLLLAATFSCAIFSVTVASEVTESNTAAVAPASMPLSSQSDDSQDEQESDWDYLRRFYDLSPPSKRAYSYVSEFKRLPVYNFGLGKRADPAGNKLYSFGLGKRRNKQYSFGLGKRPANGGLYSFGLGKRSMDYTEQEEEDPEDDESEDMEQDMDMDMEKRMKAYSFGLGKRYPQGPYSFGLGKRAPLYSFGLGKRGSKQYSFGLGKRVTGGGRQYSFGLGKREVSAAEAAAVAAESHVIKKRSPNPEQLEWADAETSRSEEEHNIPAEFGRAGRRTYSFGLGKRLPLYSFGVGKRLSA